MAWRATHVETHLEGAATNPYLDRCRGVPVHLIAQGRGLENETDIAGHRMVPRDGNRIYPWTGMRFMEVVVVVWRLFVDALHEVASGERRWWV